MKILKKILISLLVLILALVIFALGFFWYDSVSSKYSVTIDEESIPDFVQSEFPFTHRYNKKESLPIAPAALIDIDNDTIDEVFFGGGLGQKDALFAYRNNTFIDITDEVGMKHTEQSTTTGAVSADFNNDGYTDLLVGRDDGLYLYVNHNSVFTLRAIETPINDVSTPAGFTVGDIDKDGDLDIFLGTYLKKELEQGQTIFEDDTYGSTSELLINTGNNHFVNGTESAGLTYLHNTFQPMFIDIDNDTWLDLVVVYDTGEVRTYQNNTDGTFTMRTNPLTDRFAFPMGLAAGDYNNDGLVDFMFSNTGSTLPRFLAKGDIKDVSRFHEKWILFQNKGNFEFIDVAKEAKIADYEFSWGAVFADLNNDGLQDLLVAENYVDLLPHKLFRLPSRLLIQKSDNTFVSTEKKSSSVNPYFGITALVSDFNLDGYLDFIWVNIDTPSLFHLNQGGKNNFLQVKLSQDEASHIGARVVVTTESKKLTEFLVTGEGLVSDQTSLLHFGLGQERPLEVEVFYIDGTSKRIEHPKVNSILTIDKNNE